MEIICGGCQGMGDFSASWQKGGIYWLRKWLHRCTFIKTHRATHLKWVQFTYVKLKWLTTPNVGEHKGQLQLSCIAGALLVEVQKWYRHFENLLVSCKIKHTLTLWPSNCTPRCLPKRNETFIYKKTCRRIFIEALPIIAPLNNLETVWISRWRNEQIVVYSFSEILHCSISGWTPDLCNNIHDSHKYYVEWKRPDTKSQAMILLIKH